MFERFTDRGRRVLVLAQEEARLLNHDFIGTEHILLGLIDEGEGVAAKALGSLGITLEAVREKTEETDGVAVSEPSGSPPFTPRSKKVLELAFRESLLLGHNYIGTEHLLLGLLREGEGVGAQVLVALGADLATVRESVITTMSGVPYVGLTLVGQPQVSTFGRAAQGRSSRTANCSICGRDTWESAHYLSVDLVTICAECIETAHEVLRDAPVGAHQIFFPPSVYGSPPDEGSVAAITELVASALLWDSDPEQLREQIEDFDELGPFMVLAQRRPSFHSVAATLEAVRFIGEQNAAIRFRTAQASTNTLWTGQVRMVDGRWMVTRDTVTDMLRENGIPVPGPVEDE